MKPVSATLPTSRMSSARPKRVSISAHSAAVRWSFQRIAGRSTSCFASSSTRPCIWPVRPTAATSAPLAPASASAFRMLAAVPFHHSRGSCSDQSGLGVWSVSGVVADAATAPFSSIRSALAPVVETSMPRK